MRLDKYLSHSTGLSRKEIHRLLHAGKITLNEQPVRNAGLKVSEQDDIYLDGFPVEAPGARYLMLNKPVDFVCANSDGSYPTVLSLIDLPRADEMHICGRLDVDTTGLVLITNDGKWAHRVTSPRHKTGKRYRVWTSDPIPAEAVARFAEGVMLNGEDKPTLPAELEIVAENEALLTLQEGRYHQVKRMFAALGNHVQRLHREQIGTISLDEELEPGEYRLLTEDEVKGI
ncbi:16S rRNA pseudouridine(516) synthase RsuA [Marinobacterium arenosum]|uniref:16S rRNA pseudouridine(516) synthase RsuA n=1 Tax=Marinobacterium arenosum TaxID=2862496 RepID=UPI001C963412|nr:16S rRNA pseudouridine(516) synthase RsuA [Marinobacterium arenosum]MBY4678281.1 16S rRNA pseudouridine(516) synthase RsuA [Marinobacterium arenosum]